MIVKISLRYVEMCHTEESVTPPPKKKKLEAWGSKRCSWNLSPLDPGSALGSDDEMLAGAFWSTFTCTVAGRARRPVFIRIVPESGNGKRWNPSKDILMDSFHTQLISAVFICKSFWVPGSKNIREIQWVFIYPGMDYLGCELSRPWILHTIYFSPFFYIWVFNWSLAFLPGWTWEEREKIKIKMSL